jgi:hypothetical protein
VTDWSDCTVAGPGVDAPTVREFEEEFDTATERVIDADIRRRSDAVREAPTLIRTLGPRRLGDTSAGLLDRGWIIQLSDTMIVARGENDAGDGFLSEDFIFSYSPGNFPIVELDAAFNQNASVFVFAERETGSGGAGELWIYFFDATVNGGQGGFVFQNFGEGRTPKCVLDDPARPDDSDIIVFYIKDSAGGVKYRVQNERFATEHDAPFSSLDIDEFFLEEAVRSGNRRLEVTASRHDETAGTWSLQRLFSSRLYPVEVTPEEVDFSVTFVRVLNRPTVLIRTADPEEIDFSVTFLEASVPLVVAENSVPEEELDIAVVVEDVILDQLVFDGNPDEEEIDFSVTFVSAVLDLIVIIDETDPDDDEVDFSVTFVHATLEVV